MKNASVVLEAVEVDVLLLDLGGPPTLVVYAGQLKLLSCNLVRWCPSLFIFLFIHLILIGSIMSFLV